METIKPVKALEFSLDAAKMAAGRVGSNTPAHYRLLQKTDGTMVLQAGFPWRAVDNSEAGVDWSDIPTVMEEVATIPERKGCLNCGAMYCDRQTAYECGKEGTKWTPRKVQAGEIKQQQDLHAAIMNLPCNIPGTVTALGDNAVEMYKIAHRDTRHQAAELALKYKHR